MADRLVLKLSFTQYTCKALLHQRGEIFEHHFQSFLVSCYKGVDKSTFVSNHRLHKSKGSSYGARKAGVICSASPPMNTSWAYWAAASRYSGLLAAISVSYGHLPV